MKHADLILVLREGRLVEQGTHEELISRSGFYSEIVEKQLRGAERLPDDVVAQ